MHRTSLIAGLILVALGGAAIRFVITLPDPEAFEFAITEEGPTQVVLSGRDLEVAVGYVDALQERDELKGNVLTGGSLVMLVIGFYLIGDAITRRRREKS